MSGFDGIKHEVDDGNDVRGHNAKAATGLRETLRNRDAKFGDARVRVNGPEFRDEDGRLAD